ncbi:MAG: tRNA lysidine(34) synthetase TilS [Nitrospiraceae bacterium]|nr:tRNA lysidine(34) synthetase TilS [Nitrospiraceae bacterium]
MEASHNKNNSDKCHGSGLAGRMSAVIRKYGMLKNGETVVVGLSGGPDSVCLLHLLHRLRDDLRLDLHAVYVNHNLRPDEVPAEIAFCEERCMLLDLPLIVKSINVREHAAAQKMNLHEAARELRYHAFEEAAVAVKADRIALAHNADDQAETFFMRLLRGAGPKGLSGIPAVRGRIIRPLIDVERREIGRFLDEGHISYVTDSSNLKPEYFRNRVRQQLMPAVKQLNPDAVAAMLHTMEILREEERYFDIIVTKTLMRMISRKTVDRIELFMSPMESMDVVILRRVLRRAIDGTHGLRGIGLVHIDDIIRLIRDGDSGDRLYLPHGIRVIKEYALLVMTAEPLSRLSACELQPPADLPLREAGVVLRATFEDAVGDSGDGKSSVVLDAGKMVFPLTVRGRADGDCFYPLGFGKRRKLQDFFVDEKVPRDERDRVPIVLSGEDIVWIAGYRGDERFRVSEGTKKFLRLGIVKGNF